MSELVELSGDGLLFVEVAEHGDAAKLEAARRALEDHVGVFDSGVPKTIAWLAGRAHKRTMRAHREPPDDCGCEDEGWWCEQGDGEPRPFYEFELTDIYDEADFMAHEEDE